MPGLLRQVIVTSIVYGSLVAFYRPTIERANSFAPSHSRIFKELVTVTNPSKPFQFTAKGTPRRHVCLADYKDEIDKLYQRMEETSQVDVRLPPIWNENTVNAYVSSIVRKVIKADSVGNDDDIFQQGCDSLHATWIRNTILHAIRTTTKISAHDIPLNFVYAHPTIASLGSFLLGILTGKSVDKDAEHTAHIAHMNALLEKYIADLPSVQWTYADGAREVSVCETVLITGTTGRLGSQLLAQLSKKPGVVRVYALNREASGDVARLEARQIDAFRAWGLDMDEPAMGKVKFLIGELAKPSFGLDEKTFEELRTSVTTIIQNGWRVDFNLTVQSFEPLIAGTRNLVDFALSSPSNRGPKVLFVSSISSLYNYSSTTAAPESLDYSAGLAIGHGYGESKWIAEQIFSRVMQQTKLRATSVRVGHLSGDSRIGGWNAKEWVPAIARASKRLQCVPLKDDTVCWVPIDIAARALLEMLESSEPVFHLVSPQPTHWRDVFEPISAALGVPVVPATAWLSKLREESESMYGADQAWLQANGYSSAHALIEFFEDILVRKDVRFETDKAVGASRTLAELGPLGKEDVLRWIAFWSRDGL